MRLRPGRPDLSRYAGLFGVPPADPQTEVAVTWLGVSTLLLDDGADAVLTDGFFSRPGLVEVGLRRLRPRPARIADCLARAGIDRLTAVLPVHTHYDHALDTAVVAERTGAVIVGGTSAANIARGQRIPEHRIVVAEPGSEMVLGAYAVTLLESEHCPPDRFPGRITAPVTPPARAAAYRCGETWSTVVRHLPTGRRMLIQGSAGFVPGALADHRAEVAYLGVGQLGHRPADYIEQYWEQTVTAVGARRAVLIHWDDFFRPLSQPLRALPYAADDLDHTLRILTDLADRDGVTVQLPTVWQRADPWA